MGNKEKTKPGGVNRGQTRDKELLIRELLRVNRALKVLSGCNQAVIRIRDESELLREICRHIVETGGYRLAWVGFAEQDKKRSVRPVSQAGFEEGYLETLNITWSDTPRGRGPTGTCIRTGKPVICQNMLCDPNFTPWRQEASKRGYASSIALPLLTDNQTLGALNIYAPEPDAFDGKEVELLEELAADLAFGIAFIRTRIEHKKAEEELARRTQEITAIHTLAQRVSCNLSVKQVTEEALQAVVDSVSPDLALIYLQKGDNLNLMGVGPKNTKYYSEKKTVHRVGECLCGLAVSEKNSIFSEDIHNDPRCTWRECKEAGMRSFSALPLRSGDELIGVLGLGSAANRDFKQEARFLETLANEIAIGLQNALLFEEVQRYAVRLEQRVAERTAALQEKTGELEQANIKLKEADRLKSVFLASMSHELRTPLNSIIGFTGILLMGMAGELNREQEKQLTIVKNSANHLLSLINDVLDISRIEAGKIKLVNEEFALEEVVADVVETFSSQVNEKGLEFRTAVPGGITLYSDMRRIKQILMNLVSNAVKFTPRGSITITGKVLPGVHGDRLEISVADTGIGMKKEAMNKLFLPFQQVDMNLTKQFEGTGLGLYLCKNLLFHLQGDIRATSEYGKGSVFTVVLPLRAG